VWGFAPDLSRYPLASRHKSHFPVHPTPCVSSPTEQAFLYPALLHGLGGGGSSEEARTMFHQKRRVHGRTFLARRSRRRFTVYGSLDSPELRGDVQYVEPQHVRGLAERRWK
jgi:hypothetical protein